MASALPPRRQQRGPPAPPSPLRALLPVVIPLSSLWPGFCTGLGGSWNLSESKTSRTDPDPTAGPAASRQGPHGPPASVPRRPRGGGTVPPAPTDSPCDRGRGRDTVEPSRGPGLGMLVALRPEPGGGGARREGSEVGRVCSPHCYLRRDLGGAGGGLLTGRKAVGKRSPCPERCVGEGSDPPASDPPHPLEGRVGGRSPESLPANTRPVDLKS